MSDSTPPNGQSSPLIRLNKAIADSGYCARRKADALIAEGKVQVNGQTITAMGAKVNPQTDRITLLGKPLPSPEKAYLLFHKPEGFVTSRRSGKAQHSIYDLIPKEYHSVDPAGRLDQNSSGALILTNDGDFLNRITHPRFHLPKVYEIRIDRPLQPVDLEQLQAGVLLTPENKLAKMTRIIPDPTDPRRYEVELITGYNRQIRRTLVALGYRVKKLHRLSFGPIHLGSLPSGSIRPLAPDEQAALLQLENQPG
jgi:23S rRNA pseudouridine2605 synthase